MQEQRRTLAGESWTQGQVILSWPEVIKVRRIRPMAPTSRCTSSHTTSTRTQASRMVNRGDPNPAIRQRWAAVMGAAFERLQSEPSTLIDAYGPSDPAEFFAVVTEVFFEQPKELAAQEPAVYAELSKLYHLNQTEW